MFEPQFDGLVLLAELGQTNVPATPVFATFPPEGKVRPVTAGAVTGRAGTEIVRELMRRRQWSPDEAKVEINCKIGEVRPGEFRDRAAGQNQTRHVRRPLYAKQNGRRGRRQLNVLSARRSNLTHSSAGSSPSASRSAVPARICSAIRPEFCRIAASIFAVMSGLALRKALEFSRPCPRRWLS